MTHSMLQSPQVLCSSAGRAWIGLEAALVHIPGGLRSQLKGSGLHRLGMHFGPPVNADCVVGAKRMVRLQKAGDIDFIPAGIDGSWHDDADCQILRLDLRPKLLEDVAGELGRDISGVALLPRLQLRDPRIEAIGWAIKADLEAFAPSDPLYIDSLANALAVRLIEMASDRGANPDRSCQKMSRRQMRVLADYIETNLGQKLHLLDLVAVTAIGATRLKTLFRNSFGMSIHRYVIRRRVEYARAMLSTTTLPASEIALAAGFSHQSHMSVTMRRVLGQTPGEIERLTIEIRPNLQKPV